MADNKDQKVQDSSKMDPQIKQDIQSNQEENESQIAEQYNSDISRNDRGFVPMEEIEASEIISEESMSQEEDNETGQQDSK